MPSSCSPLPWNFGRALVGLQFHQHVVLGGGVDLVHVELRAVAVDGAVAAQRAHDAHTGLELDIDGDGLGAGGQHVVELLVEDLHEVGRLAGEGVIAVTGAGERQHQILVVAEAQPDRADRNALAQQRAAQHAEIGRTRRAAVGLAVRQQDDAIEPLRLLVAAHLVGADQHAGVDGGRAARVDLLDGALRTGRSCAQAAPA